MHIRASDALPECAVAYCMPCVDALLATPASATCPMCRHALRSIDDFWPLASAAAAAPSVAAAPESKRSGESALCAAARQRAMQREIDVWRSAPGDRHVRVQLVDGGCDREAPVSLRVPLPLPLAWLVAAIPRRSVRDDVRLCYDDRLVADSAASTALAHR
jgi:hypothetical protein